MVAYFLGKRFCKFSVNIAVLGTCQTAFDSSLSSCGCNYNPVLWFCVQMALEQHLLAPRPSCSLILVNYQDGKRACRSAAPRFCFTYKESESWQIMAPEQQTHGQGWPPEAHWIFMTLLCTNIDPHAPGSMAKDMASFYRHQYRINENHLLKLWDDSSRPQLVEGFRMRKQRKEAKWSLAIGCSLAGQPAFQGCGQGLWVRQTPWQAPFSHLQTLSLSLSVFIYEIGISIIGYFGGLNTLHIVPGLCSSLSFELFVCSFQLRVEFAADGLRKPGRKERNLSVLGTKSLSHTRLRWAAFNEPDTLKLPQNPERYENPGKACQWQNTQALKHVQEGFFTELGARLSSPGEFHWPWGAEEQQEPTSQFLTPTATQSPHVLGEVGHTAQKGLQLTICICQML